MQELKEKDEELRMPYSQTSTQPKSAINEFLENLKQQSRKFSTHSINPKQHYDYNYIHPIFVTLLRRNQK